MSPLVWFYIDFTAQKRLVTSMLGTPLKQVVGRLEPKGVRMR